MTLFQFLALVWCLFILVTGGLYPREQGNFFIVWSIRLAKMMGGAIAGTLFIWLAIPQEGDPLWFTYVVPCLVIPFTMIYIYVSLAGIKPGEPWHTRKDHQGRIAINWAATFGVTTFVSVRLVGHFL